jgi:tetratricopeptide (TPR) repeat protein
VPLPLSGIIAAILIALQPATLHPAALQPSAPLPVSPVPQGAALPVQDPRDAPKAAAAIGGTPYLDLLKRYRDGDYEGAVKGMAVLPEGRSDDRVIEALESIGRDITGADDPRKASQVRQLMLANAWAIAVPAAAALHLETGYALMLAGRFEPARDHLHVARQVIDHPRFSLVTKIRPELQDAHARFRRDIYLGVLWALQADQDYSGLTQHLERIGGVYPEDGDVELAFGSFEEYQGSSAVIRALRPPTALMASGPWRQNAQQARLKSAEKYFREALKLDSSLVEARMRLGRVLQQRGLMQDARTELEAAFGQPGAPPAIRYLASIFLIDVLEAEGNRAAALARARDLTARYPECQSAHLTLSRAYEARGQRAAALAALAPLWKEEKARTCADPWWNYYLGQTWRMAAWIASLRERVRGAK